MSVLDGILLIDKPEGASSAAVLNRLKRALPRGVKLGHGGTLDPFATGLLVSFLGQATRLSQCFLSGDKEYVATVHFGKATASGDPTTEVVSRSEKTPASFDELATAASSFEGAYHQMPPMYSAVKKDGKPLYELARKGEEVEREVKVRRIERFEVLEFSPPNARVRVSCSGGTYIRTLAEDWAKKMGTVAMLTSLRRTRSSRFSIEKASTVESIIEALEKKVPATELSSFVPFDEVFSVADGITVNAPTEKKILQGEKRTIDSVCEQIRMARFSSAWIPVFNPKMQLIAYFQKTEITSEQGKVQLAGAFVRS